MAEYLVGERVRVVRTDKTEFLNIVNWDGLIAGVFNGTLEVRIKGRGEYLLSRRDVCPFYGFSGEARQ
jgi:hypothetical protein